MSDYDIFQFEFFLQIDNFETESVKSGESDEVDLYEPSDADLKTKNLELFRKMAKVEKCDLHMFELPFVASK